MTVQDSTLLGNQVALETEESFWKRKTIKERSERGASHNGTQVAGSESDQEPNPPEVNPPEVDKETPGSTEKSKKKKKFSLGKQANLAILSPSKRKKSERPEPGAEAPSGGKRKPKKERRMEKLGFSTWRPGSEDKAAPRRNEAAPDHATGGASAPEDKSISNGGHGPAQVAQDETGGQGPKEKTGRQVAQEEAGSSSPKKKRKSLLQKLKKSFKKSTKSVQKMKAPSAKVKGKKGGKGRPILLRQPKLLSGASLSPEDGFPLVLELPARGGVTYPGGKLPAGCMPVQVTNGFEAFADLLPVQGAGCRLRNEAEPISG